MGTVLASLRALLPVLTVLAFAIPLGVIGSLLA
jgi:hypothetical protein